MSTHATLLNNYALPSVVGTPEPLSNGLIRFHKLILRGYKAKGVINTSNVYFRPLEGEWIELEPGTERVVPIPDGAWIRASQIEIDIATAGDGVQYDGSAAVVYEGP